LFVYAELFRGRIHASAYEPGVVTPEIAEDEKQPMWVQRQR